MCMLVPKFQGKPTVMDKPTNQTDITILREKQLKQIQMIRNQNAYYSFISFGWHNTK